MKVIVAFSGGKDSLASLIWTVVKYGAKKVEAVFCDTGWEHPITYEHIIEMCKKLGVRLVTLKSKKFDGFEGMVKKKKRFPSTKARFCTEELKTYPMIDYVLSHTENLIIIQGIRAEESESRSLMKKQCTYFKYYFEPYKSNKIIIAQLESKEKLTLIQEKKLKKAKARLKDGHNDERYHSYRKKDVIKFRENYADDILRPFFEKTAHETLTYILDAGYKPNPLYYIIGAGRVGCFPCIMVSLPELWSIIQKEPWIIHKIKKMELKYDTTFFPPNKIPERYHDKTVETTKGEIKTACTITAVVRYLKDKHATGSLFEEEENDDTNKSCMSFYGICD